MGLARASATESLGNAEAGVVQKKLLAEAEGLVRKFEAIASLSDQARGHEEFRMMLDNSLKQALASIEAGKEVSRENANVIASALRNADIDLVGGDGGMFENLVKAVSLGKSIEGFAGKSPIVQELMQRYLGVAVAEPAPRQIAEDADAVPTVSATVVDSAR
ncbi:hypothetical protein R1V99_23355, partial [Stenotrophomonas maltophilia]|nr:hypothetical protein [Stenotrophomonas maltophilia]